VCERNGGGKNGEEAKEEHRGVSPFLSGPDSRNRHKSRRFIICVGRHTKDTIGWRTCERRDYEKKEKEMKEKEMKKEDEKKKWMNVRQVLAGADLGGDSAAE